MQVLLAFLSLVMVASAAKIDVSWGKFKSAHAKRYASADEDHQHFETYRANLQKIENHNKMYELGNLTWYMGENQLTDMTVEEIKDYYKLRPLNVPKLNNVTIFKTVGGNIPDHFDWRERNGLNSVKNQRSCGSCYAFASLCSVESRYFKVHGRKVSLSEQQIVDCSGSYGNQGCNGGWITTTYDYIKENDINRDSDYPYVGSKQNCRADGNKNVKVKLSEYVQTPSGDEEKLKEAIYLHGAVAVAIYWPDNLFMYKGGIYKHEGNNKGKVNHGVAVVGYGKVGKNNYWIVRNSWGADWGDNGYIYMISNAITQYAFFPIIDA